MRKEYHKLVRDAIPDIIRSRGQICEVNVLTEENYRQALREKLVEEAHEVVAASTSGDLVTELADLQEVLDALMRVYAISPEVVRVEQERRRSERGGFEHRLRLLWTE
jgi:predicted house-cleaning noncanonical NTP pyrophosphatase (MazG superfamily)